VLSNQTGLDTEGRRTGVTSALVHTPEGTDFTVTSASDGTMGEFVLAQGVVVRSDGLSAEVGTNHP